MAILFHEGHEQYTEKHLIQLYAEQNLKLAFVLASAVLCM